MKHRILFPILLALVFATRTAAQGPEVLTNAKIIQLVKDGEDESFILTVIASDKNTFRVGVNDREERATLKAAGVSPAILQAMYKAMNDPALAYADPDDPLAWHKPGIHYRAPGGKLTGLMPTKLQAQKTGNKYWSNVTAWVKQTELASVPGVRSLNDLSGISTLYFYFGGNTDLDMSVEYGFSRATSPAEYVLARMDVKESGRELELGSFSAYNAEAGLNAKHVVQFAAIKELAHGVFEVTLPALQPGEYCILHTGISGWNATDRNIFDFHTDGRGGMNVTGGASAPAVPPPATPANGAPTSTPATPSSNGPGTGAVYPPTSPSPAAAPSTGIETASLDETSGGTPPDPEPDDTPANGQGPDGDRPAYRINAPAGLPAGDAVQGFPAPKNDTVRMVPCERPPRLRAGNLKDLGDLYEARVDSLCAELDELSRIATKQAQKVRELTDQVNALGHSLEYAKTLIDERQEPGTDGPKAPLERDAPVYDRCIAHRDDPARFGVGVRQVYTLLHPFSSATELDTFRVVTAAAGSAYRHELRISTVAGAEYAEQLFALPLEEVEAPSRCTDMEVEFLRARQALSPAAFERYPVSITDSQVSDARESNGFGYDIEKAEFQAVYADKPFCGFWFQSDPERRKTLVWSPTLGRIVNVEPEMP